MDILAAAERLLSKELGREVRLGEAARLSEDGRRNVLLRCRDLSGGFPPASQGLARNPPAAAIPGVSSCVAEGGGNADARVKGADPMRFVLGNQVFDWAIIPSCFFALLGPRWELGG